MNADLTSSLAQWWVSYLVFGITALLGSILAIHNPPKRSLQVRWCYGLSFLALFLLGLFVTKAQHDQSAIDTKRAAEGAREDVRQEIVAAVKPYQDQISELKSQNGAMAEDLRTIRTSNIVTGRGPVKVEVTKGSIGPPVLKTSDVVLSWQPLESTYSDAPYCKKLIFQSAVPITNLGLAVTFTHPIIHLDSLIQTWYQGKVEIDPQNRKRLLMIMKGFVHEALRPDYPLAVIACSTDDFEPLPSMQRFVVQ